MTLDAHLRRLYGMVAVLAAAPLVSVVSFLLLWTMGALGVVLVIAVGLVYGIFTVRVWLEAVRMKYELVDDLGVVPTPVPPPARQESGKPPPKRASSKAKSSARKPKATGSDPDPWRD